LTQGRGVGLLEGMPVARMMELLKRDLQRLGLLHSTQSLLGWDEQVNLPAGSAAHRARQASVLADLVHREATRPEIGQWLAGLEGHVDQLSADDQVIVREARRDYDRATRVPPDLVARKVALSSEAYHAWAAARKRRDFADFAPYLERHLDLAREEAACFGKSGPAAYDHHIDKHDPGLDAAFIQGLFETLARDLVPLAAAILDSPVRARPGIFRNFPVDKQEAFLREVTTALGFDYQHGRLDRSLHPFCSGNGADIRMTTRFDPDNPLDSLFSSIHETGHGMYEQGLPEDRLGTALGQAVGMAVHESQSRLWENQISRSRAFWSYWEPRFRTLFAEELADISSEELYLAINAVERQPIRVDADEVMYNLHIMLRFRLERALFQKEISVREVPMVWAELSLELLGMVPEHDGEGCLQDVHWSGGAFGYFPSYCLGNMMAAQLWDAVRVAEPGLEADFESGRFERLLSWLRREVHQQGRRYNTRELVRRVTGRDLGPEALLGYLRERYGELYL